MQSFARGIHFKGPLVLCVYQSKWDLWVPPGGVIETNETAEQALCRELDEELGIIPITYSLMHDGHFKFKDIDWYGFIFLIRAFTGEMRIREPEKHKAFAYKQISEIHPKYQSIVQAILHHIN